MIYIICDFWNVLYFSRYFSNTCFHIGSYGEGITLFLLFRCFSDFQNLGVCLPFRKLYENLRDMCDIWIEHLFWHKYQLRLWRGKYSISWTRHTGRKTLTITLNDISSRNEVRASRYLTLKNNSRRRTIRRRQSWETLLWEKGF